MKKNVKILVIMVVIVFLSVFGFVKVQAADITLKNGKWENGTLTTELTKNYYKISAKKTGYVKIEYVRDNRSLYAEFSICNGKKKKIWDNGLEDFDNKSTVYFPVKKGTYYICISDTASPWNGGEDDDIVYNENPTEHYKIKYTFTAMKEGKKAATLNKAPLLKKKKKVSGLFFLSKKQQNACFKYIVSENKKVRFSYEIFGLWLRVADSQGKFLSFDSKGRIKKGGDSVTWWENKGSDYVILPKGTYYFIIQQWDAGYYKLELK